MKPTRHPFFACVLGLALALSLSACNDSDPSVANGALSINQGAEITTGEGVALTVPLSLNASREIKALAVTMTSSDPAIATIWPKTCYLSSTPAHDACRIFLRGKKAGAVTISASAPGYTKTSTRLVVTPNFELTSSAKTTQAQAVPQAAGPNYGQLQIASYPSARAPSTSNFPMTAMMGDTITLAASITGFNTPLNGVPILLSVNNGASIVGNPQCDVDSNYDANHYCLYKVKLPNNTGTVTATAQAVGNNANDFSNTPTATITVQNTPVVGTIALQGTGAGIPQGMSSPFWVVLQDSSGVTSPLRVSVSGSSGLAINPSSGSTADCTLSSESPVCGFGVLGSTLSPSGVNDVLSATEASHSYVISPLNVAVVAPESTTRTFTFQNNDTTPIWVGITGGTATSFATNLMVAKGADVTCGPSNPAAACPTGSTCRQGGATPNADTVYQCYWDQPAPSNGYAIALGTQPTTAISISNSSYSPLTDITWSGNFYPRQGCSTSNGAFTCAIANCGNGSSQACAPGTGGAPGIATLAEVTLQANNNDYYDLSIIGGATVKTAFGPDAASAPPTADNYFCGTAGSSSAQGALAASDWDMATHIQQSQVANIAAPYSTSIQTAATPSTAYYRYIQTPQNGRVGIGCATQSGQSADNYCAALNSSYVCGYDAKAVNDGAASDYQTSCGAHLAWLSANAVFAMNADTTKNAAPFPFAATYSTSAAGTVSLSSLYLCNNSTNKSGYAKEDASITCGCTNWGDSSLGLLGGDASFTAPLAAPSEACSTNNLANSTYWWTKYVLPSIAWLKQACPTCYTYPFDDMSSTFQCSKHSTASGVNAVDYLIQFNGTIAGRH